jgi:hypothetical protein
MGERGNGNKQVTEYVQCDNTGTFAVSLPQKLQDLQKSVLGIKCVSFLSKISVLKLFHSDK